MTLASKGPAAEASYRLFRYQDGLAPTKHLAGVPLIFLPGNAGSYEQVRLSCLQPLLVLRRPDVTYCRLFSSAIPSHPNPALRNPLQVRSLGSQLARSYQEGIHGSSFDVFTIDYAEELTGLYGGLVPVQAAFLRRCVSTVLDMYRSRPPTSRPISVVLVAHSMGGVVARHLLAAPDFDNRMVNTLVTLATPHGAPAVMVDHRMRLVFATMAQQWYLWGEGGPGENNTVPLIVSLAGGRRDTMIRTGLAVLPTQNGAVAQAETTMIPGVWASADHLCILWCKQLVVALAEMLHATVSKKTHLVSGALAHGHGGAQVKA